MSNENDFIIIHPKANQLSKEQKDSLYKLFNESIDEVIKTQNRMQEIVEDNPKYFLRHLKCKCGSSKFYTLESENKMHVALKCCKCNKWKKWISKSEKDNLFKYQIFS